MRGRFFPGFGGASLGGTSSEGGSEGGTRAGQMQAPPVHPCSSPAACPAPSPAVGHLIKIVNFLGLVQAKSCGPPGND